MTGSGPVKLRTSSSVDWVIEYIDDKGTLHMVNNQDGQNPEKAEFIGSGKIIYVKIYPYDYTENSEVFLYAENVKSVSVSPTVPAPFAATAPQTPTGTPQSAPLPLMGIIAIGITLLLSRK